MFARLRYSIHKALKYFYCDWPSKTNLNYCFQGQGHCLAHLSIVSSRSPLRYRQLTDWSLERQREKRQCRLELYLKLFVFVLSLLLTWSLQRPPAIFASYCGNLSALRKLIQRGADVALVSSTGFNCLDVAIKSGNTDVCMELVQNKKYESQTCVYSPVKRNHKYKIFVFKDHKQHEI